MWVCMLLSRISSFSVVLNKSTTYSGSVTQDIVIEPPAFLKQEVYSIELQDEHLAHTCKASTIGQPTQSLKIKYDSQTPGENKLYFRTFEEIRSRPRVISSAFNDFKLVKLRSNYKVLINDLTENKSSQISFSLPNTTFLDADIVYIHEHHLIVSDQGIFKLDPKGSAKEVLNLLLKDYVKAIAFKNSLIIALKSSIYVYEVSSNCEQIKFIQSFTSPTLNEISDVQICFERDDSVYLLDVKRGLFMLQISPKAKLLKNTNSLQNCLDFVHLRDYLLLRCQHPNQTDYMTEGWHDSDGVWEFSVLDTEQDYYYNIFADQNFIVVSSYYYSQIYRRTTNNSSNAFRMVGRRWGFNEVQLFAKYQDLYIQVDDISYTVMNVVRTTPILSCNFSHLNAESTLTTRVIFKGQCEESEEVCSYYQKITIDFKKNVQIPTKYYIIFIGLMSVLWVAFICSYLRSFFVLKRTESQYNSLQEEKPQKAEQGEKEIQLKN